MTNEAAAAGGGEDLAQVALAGGGAGDGGGVDPRVEICRLDPSNLYASYIDVAFANLMNDFERFGHFCGPHSSTTFGVLAAQLVASWLSATDAASAARFFRSLADQCETPEFPHKGFKGRALPPEFAASIAAVFDGTEQYGLRRAAEHRAQLQEVLANFGISTEETQPEPVN